jgi:hypothetical protein
MRILMILTSICSFYINRVLSQARFDNKDDFDFEEPDYQVYYPVWPAGNGDCYLGVIPEYGSLCRRRVPCGYAILCLALILRNENPSTG